MMHVYKTYKRMDCTKIEGYVQGEVADSTGLLSPISTRGIIG
jgi:hypothetical protein